MVAYCSRLLKLGRASCPGRRLNRGALMVYALVLLFAQTIVRYLENADDGVKTRGLSRTLCNYSGLLSQ